MLIKFSLLIATVNRLDPLRRLLASLAQQSRSDFQVLLADQNPPGFLDGLIEEFSSRLALTVVKVPNRGVSQARNALFPLIEGDIVAFPDDDCFYAPDTLQAAAKLFDEFPLLHGLMATWRAPEKAASPWSLSGHAPLRVLDKHAVFKRGETYVQFYRREVVEKVGGFDPELGPGTGLPYGCGEDTDYALRVLAAGFNMARAPGVRVYHPAVDLSNPRLGSKLRAYAAGRMHLLKKHHFSFFTQVLHAFYPLAMLPITTLFRGKNGFGYRWDMFRWRVVGLFAKSR